MWVRCDNLSTFPRLIPIKTALILFFMFLSEIPGMTWIVAKVSWVSIFDAASKFRI
jgi:hypothetical protein